MIKIIPPKIT